jgi:hypothetical protein
VRSFIWSFVIISDQFVAKIVKEVQGARSMEHGAGGREQGAGGREQGAWSMEHAERIEYM